VLVEVGTSWRDTWALGPFTVRRQAPDVRAGGRMSGGSRGAGCPGLEPDVRVGDARFFCSLDCVRRISEGCAGCPGFGEAPDVRALSHFGCWAAAVVDIFRGRMSGPGAGCPGPGDLLWFLSSCSFVHVLGDLSVILSISERVFLVPKHM
jgi:hypothetical protein